MLASDWQECSHRLKLRIRIRTIGGSIQTAWRSTVNKDLLRMGITRQKAEVAANNRSEWHRSVAQCIYLDAGGLNQGQGFVVYFVYKQEYVLWNAVALTCIDGEAGTPVAALIQIRYSSHIIFTRWLKMWPIPWSTKNIPDGFFLTSNKHKIYFLPWTSLAELTTFPQNP